jgi:hypothetical protein
MAKGQLRSNKEVRKPKKDKKPAVAEGAKTSKFVAAGNKPAQKGKG